jgi:hypothetical protein
MRWLVLLLSLAMPVVSWFSQQGVFGPTNGAISDRYPTLIVAAGYAFAAAGFALTAVWMPVFSQQLFWLALLIIWSALACLLTCALKLSTARITAPGLTAWAWAPLSLHAGWLSLAAFLNTAQVIVAYRLLPTDAMLPWTLVLFALATALLLWANHRMRGNLPFVAAALWALAAVYVKQSGWRLPGSDTAALVAVVVALVLTAQTVWLRLRPQPRTAVG